MRHDDAADHPGRRAPTRRVAQAVAAVPVLIAYARRLGETGAKIVRGARLERLAVLHHRSEEHTSELQSLMRLSYSVFCLRKQKSTSTPLYTLPKYTTRNHHL